MLKLKFNRQVKSILKKLINDGFLIRHIIDVGDNFTNTFFDNDEVMCLLATIKEDDRTATARELSKIYPFNGKEIKDLTTMLYTITEREILFHYYLKETLSEEEILLLKEYENVALLNPTIQAELENIQETVAEMEVTNIEYLINEHTIRLLKNIIFDILEKKLKSEDTYAEEDNAICRSKYIRIWNYEHISK